MNQGIRIIYPVTDLARAKAMFQKLLGVEPYVDSAYYVGCKVEGQVIRLDPNGHTEGMTPYFPVDNIKQSLPSLGGGGAQILLKIKDNGGGGLIGAVRDTEGNIIGLIQ